MDDQINRRRSHLDPASSHRTTSRHPPTSKHGLQSKQLPSRRSRSQRRRLRSLVNRNPQHSYHLRRRHDLLLQQHRLPRRSLLEQIDKRRNDLVYPSTRLPSSRRILSNSDRLSTSPAQRRHVERPSLTTC